MQACSRQKSGLRAYIVVIQGVGDGGHPSPWRRSGEITLANAATHAARSPSTHPASAVGMARVRRCRTVLPQRSRRSPAGRTLDLGGVATSHTRIGVSELISEVGIVDASNLDAIGDPASV